MNKKTTTDWLNDFNDENIESYDTYINKLLTENKFVSELKEESGKVDSKIEYHGKLVALPTSESMPADSILNAYIPDFFSFTPHIIFVLEKLGVHTVRDLLSLKETTFCSQKGIGAKAVGIVRNEFNKKLFKESSSYIAIDGHVENLIVIRPEENIPFWMLGRPIESLYLTPGVIKTLHSLNCYKIGDLENVKTEDFISCKGIGWKSVKRIKEEFNSKVLHEIAPTIPEVMQPLLGENYLYCPPFPSKLKLPITNSSDFLSTQDTPTESFNYLCELIQAKWCVDQLKEISVGENTLADLFRSEKQQDRIAASEILDFFAYPFTLFMQAESFKQLLVQCIVDANPKLAYRALDMYIRNKGLLSEKQTLQEIADDYNLTRERVRQLIQKVDNRTDLLNSIRFLPMRLIVLSEAQKLGGTGELSELERRIRAAFPKDSMITKAIRVSPDLEIDTKNKVFSISNLPCKKCSSLYDEIKRLEEEKGITTITQLRELVGCNECMSGCLVNACWISAQSSLITANGHIGSSQNPEMKATFKPNSARAAIQAALYNSKKALTYDEIIQEVFNKTGKTITKSMVGSQVQTFEDCLLWGRGTYIHEKNAVTPTELLESIISFVAERFKDSNTPLVNVGGLYDLYEHELCSAGVPSGHALYSLIRRANDPRLILREYPWVCDVDTIGNRTSFAKYFYSILQDNNGFITDAHAEAIANKTMAQSFALGGLAEYSPFLINANGGWYDIDAAEFDMDGLASFATEIASKMEQDDIISTAKIFQENKERCFKMGIKSYDILYYLIDLIEDDLPIEASRKPHLIKSTEKHMSVRDAVKKYVANSEKPVSYMEIIEEFKIKRGINTAGICNKLILGGDIILVGDETYWSRKKMKIGNDFVSRFEDAIEAQIRNVTRQSDLYYERKLVLSTYDCLPDLENFSWNQELLAAVFDQSTSYKVFGEHFSCIVDLSKNPTVLNVEEFYVSLLENEFMGWTMFDKFKEYCAAHSIRSDLEPEFFDAFSRIEADDVAIQVV